MDVKMILKIHPQQKLSKHIASGFLMPTIASFRILKKTCNETNFYFKKNLKLLTKEQQESYEYAKICYICQEKFENKCF